ncbi:hypothetical protein Y032_0003g1446 [Ancylostoma ceylanicum]|uniref:Uncharacterized protein n=1 Tax=Ancylostoma ceylanicum TaxID=53326 RepID=A0A016VXY6_9BILA|nr:hypothetical protein Y032_0003g1446 [Ancylostoma ceylanicum]
MVLSYHTTLHYTTLYSPYAPSVESFRARRACGACAACPACNSGPGSSISCSRTALLAFGPDQYSRSSHL